MRALNSCVLLIDLHSSCFSSHKQIPISSNLISSSLRRAGRVQKRVAPSRVLAPSIPAPEIRRPFEWREQTELSNSASTSRVTELEAFLELLPWRMRKELLVHREIGNLIEVVMDLGRKPLARFPSGDWIILEQPVRDQDLKHAVSKVGDFSDDNRSGINNSLHRISAIRNRKMQIIGLTCRVGRTVSGSAAIIRDLVEDGGSILVIGPPGVGKTTLIREIARMLADEHMKRVVIVDTSNEIGGDGDVPHAGIGRARRMQVPNVNMQHSVMIEAVENHMPETIIIDEIGTELEALAASTIAQRGVQLVGTAHGVTIENVIKNPSLQILVGGIESVTLGDEEAKKRKVQKTILERKGPPTFTCALEMISRTEVRVHHRLDATVDAILAGKPPLFEIRQMDAEEDCSSDSTQVLQNNYPEKSGLTIRRDKIAEIEYDEKDEDLHRLYRLMKHVSGISVSKRSSPLSVYTCEILEVDLLQVVAVMGLEDKIGATNDLETADAILASSSELKQNQWLRGVAKFYQLPIFAIKSNTMAQMVKAVRMILGMESFSSTSKQPEISHDIEVEEDAPKRKPTLEELDALEEVRLAIEYIVIPGGEPVELLPRRSDIIARQLELVKTYQLAAENSGTELSPRLQILPLRINKKQPSSKSAASSLPSEKENGSKSSVTSGSIGTTVTRLPLLPE
ncbi:hypothetical protein HS088_TW21G01638 [Tripterygium wilfordii]|uniref:AAA+ ATPase domain-containing protein n=1 Tax=Tripterygium wilfordii TaxID=458696 RepID=A0A7J7C5U1_TRIWF|nr:protein SEEDLING PLASTID DEVELOPMENT 1 [Tripterygium wilfordii]KAF5729472.1 hypothetical protein HS088_TW21G01638 [Tripterygium wilfordii]